MSLKYELILALWVAVALISIWVGTVNLKHADAAWARAAELLVRRGKAAVRSRHWDRSRVFNGWLSICVGVMLLGLSGFVCMRQLGKFDETPVSYFDPAAGAYVDRRLSPEETKQLDRDPNGFYQKLANTGGKPAARP